MLLPFFRPAQIAQIREEQVNLKIEVRVQVVRFDVKLGPEEYNVIDFDFLLAVADQEGLGQEAGLLIDDLRWHQIVVVWALLAGF